MIPHEQALVMIRTKPGHGRRWVRAVVRDRIAAKQVENIQAMQQVHRAAQHAEAVDTVIDLLGAEVIERDNGVSAR